MNKAIAEIDFVLESPITDEEIEEIKESQELDSKDEVVEFLGEKLQNDLSRYLEKEEVQEMNVETSLQEDD